MKNSLLYVELAWASYVLLSFNLLNEIVHKGVLSKLISFTTSVF